MLHQRQRVLREAGAAEAGAGVEEPAADALVEPDAAGDVAARRAPTFSHRSAISLMKVTFIARKTLAAYLISSAVRRVV